MADETANLILEHLRGLRNEIAAFRSDTREDLRDIKARLSSLEQHVASLRQD